MSRIFPKASSVAPPSQDTPPATLRGRFLRSDLACESGAPRHSTSRTEGARYVEYEKNGVSVARLTISDARGVAQYGREIGTYVTISTQNVLYLSSEERASLTAAISAELRRLAEEVTGERVSHASRVLVAGLGNADLTADALGPETLRSLPVTRHLQGVSPTPDEERSASIAALAPGVLAQTGIETLELIRGALAATTPDLLVVIDALVAGSCERLASTVQLSSAGLRPGSGIGNNREALTRESTGYPVIAIGVPTVVDSSSLVYDALMRAGVAESAISPELIGVLENGKSFFVSPKEIDCITKIAASIIAEAIEGVFLPLAEDKLSV